MYVEGQGVPQDYVLAHMCFNLSVSRFPASEGEKREVTEKIIDIVASKMTPAQIAEEKRLAREWKPKVEEKQLGVKVRELNLNSPEAPVPVLFEEYAGEIVERAFRILCRTKGAS